MTVLAPFPYFGGKSKVKDLVWSRLGNVEHYIEPFAGSLAMLLNRPSHYTGKIETVGDLNGFVANFWRALKFHPEELAEKAEGPLIEVDLVPQRRILVNSEDSLVSKMTEDLFYCDIDLAAYWVRGICATMGNGFPWENIDGARPQLHTGDGVFSLTRRDRLPEVFKELSERLKHVRICYSSWEKLVSPYVLAGKAGNTITGVFLDPPYTDKAERASDLYGIHDSFDVGYKVHEWCLENGDNPNLRIALCGYEGEYDLPDTWECLAWTTSGGYANMRDKNLDNKYKERIWFSPHCLETDVFKTGLLANFI